MLRGLLADAEAREEVARFPGALYAALVGEYTLRFGSEPVTGDELPVFARTLLSEHGTAIKSVVKSRWHAPHRSPVNVHPSHFP